jgi:hypothetical protein
MNDIFKKLTSEYRTFNLDKINIEDEGMEDLEKFNEMYNVKSSKCSLFEEIKPVNTDDYPYFNNDINSTISNINCDIENTMGKNSIFRIDFYFRRIIENMQKPKIKKLIFELGNLSDNNFLILTKIKSIKSNWPKKKLVEMAVDIILGLIIKE